jgi:hypothetical protein
MTITFERDKDVIAYALEKIIVYARDNQYIFLAQSVWWISSILGLQEGLVIHIDNLRAHKNIKFTQPRDDIDHIHPDRIQNLEESDRDSVYSEAASTSTGEDDIHNEIIHNCETFLAQSKQERKAAGRLTRQASRVVKRKATAKKTYQQQTDGIAKSELDRRQAAGECQRCAWPRDRKGSHKTTECFHWQRVEKEPHFSQRIQDTIKIRI